MPYTTSFVVMAYCHLSSFEEYFSNEIAEDLLSNFGNNYCSRSSDHLKEGISKVDEISAAAVHKPTMEKRYQCSVPSLEILRNNGSGTNRLSREKVVVPERQSVSIKESRHRLSTDEIMKIAGKQFIQFSYHRVDLKPMLKDSSDRRFRGLSQEEIKDIELVDFLLASAEKVSNKEIDCATELLRQCDCLSSSTGNPVERLVYHFSQALREKLELESKVSRKNISFDLDEVMNHSPLTIRYHKEVPFSQAEQCAGVQAIVESVAEAKRVHVIDLCIRRGLQWALLLQALVSRHENPIEHLKITAIGKCSKSMEETGKWLIQFALSLKLPLSFNVVLVSDILDLKEDQFEIETEETIVVYSRYYLWSLIKPPDRLHSLMGVIRNINPCIMVVVEVETNLSSTSFVRRFVEALFYVGAHFDCLEACMARNDPYRRMTECQFGQGVKNSLVSEGEERMVHVDINVWRAFFLQFQMVEQDLSMSALYHADLSLKNFSCGNSCTLTRDGKSLVLGWKGTPLLSLSVWKFI